jgi:hypothetical protein
LPMLFRYESKSVDFALKSRARKAHAVKPE